MILVFDLDDTLYNEISFVESGFKAVAGYMNKVYGLSTKDLFEDMITELELNGRGKIFDGILLKHGLFSKKAVGKCLSIYRYHTPDIHLHQEAKRCLLRFESYNKYLVTDGNKLVQANKVKALNIEKKFKKVFITHRFGLKASKPSPYCFEKICSLEKVKPGRIIYIGDNPEKDFLGIKPLGFKTIRVLTGQYKEVKRPPDYEAHFSIDSLDQLTENLIAKL